MPGSYSAVAEVAPAERRLVLLLYDTESPHSGSQVGTTCLRSVELHCLAASWATTVFLESELIHPPNRVMQL